MVYACMQLVLEGSMFLCEVVGLACSILIVKWDMAADGGQGGYQDMAVYSVMCGISTACALAITISLLVVPAHVRTVVLLQCCSTSGDGPSCLRMQNASGDVVCTRV
jgi:hypothetical protein